jgi:twinkle protein
MRAPGRKNFAHSRKAWFLCMVSIVTTPALDDYEEPSWPTKPLFNKLVSPKDKLESLTDLWDKGLPPGFKTGWPSVDQLYTVVPGQLTIVTGWPSSGKSEWVDALLVNLARQDWRLAYFSPENMPVELHIAKLMEKFSGSPFGDGPTKRVSKKDLAEWAEHISQHMRFLAPMEGSLSAQDVCKHTEDWLTLGGPSGLVIDPWNELEHWRPGNMSETEYVSKTLSEVRQWARRTGVHVWIIAHPQKMKREDGILPVPRPDMISGSQHWWNKADACITIFRDFTKPDASEIEVHVQKCRFKHVGKIGIAKLKYDRITGRYAEISKFNYAERRG